MKLTKSEDDNFQGCLNLEAVRLGGDHLSMDAFLQLQSNLWNGFVDRCRSMSEQSIHSVLSGIMKFLDALWLPDMVRTELSILQIATNVIYLGFQDLFITYYYYYYPSCVLTYCCITCKNIQQIWNLPFDGPIYATFATVTVTLNLRY